MYLCIMNINGIMMNGCIHVKKKIEVGEVEKTVHKFPRLICTQIRIVESIRNQTM